MRVGDCVRTLRGAAGLQQRELADRLGVSASMLSLIESGKREPTVRMLRDIARVLGIPSAVLFAVALADDEPASKSNTPVKLRELIDRLIRAAAHTLEIERDEQHGASRALRPV